MHAVAQVASKGQSYRYRYRFWRRIDVAGFTLIELMVVLGIVGILLAAGIPVYRNYTLQTRVAEGLNLAAPARAGVAVNANAGAADLTAGVAPVGSTRGVSGIAVASNGTITITYSTVVAAAGANTLKLIPYTGSGTGKNLLSAGEALNESLKWQCAAAGVSAIGGETAGTLAANLAPPECRADQP